MDDKLIFRNPFNRKQRTLIKWQAKKELEQYFVVQKKPSVKEIACLADSLQLDNKVVRVWFYNRRQKEKSSRISMSTSMRMFPVEEQQQQQQGKPIEREKSSDELVQFPDSIVTQSNEKRNNNQVHSYNLSINLSATQNSGNVKRFSLGQPNGSIQRRTVLVLGTKEFVHKKFIDQIINYIVNIKKGDKFRLQVVEEEGQSNCVLVYDIHRADGFRIPYSLTIVITPYPRDWEDSGQLFRDHKAAETFHRFLEDKCGIQELDMICNLVINTGNNTEPFLSIFGKDVEKNINNWELTTDFLGDNAPWPSVVQHFFAVLTTMKPKSLLLTKLLLDERKKLERMVETLESLIVTVLAKLEEMSKAKQMVEYYQLQIQIENRKFHSSSWNNSESTGTAQYFPTFSENLNLADLNNHQPWENSDQDYYETKIRLNKDSKSNGQDLIKTLQKDLLENGTVLRDTFHTTWRSIEWINSVALQGNTMFTQKLFDVLFKVEQLLKQIGF